MITTRLFMIEREICKMHGGSIKEVDMCLNTFEIAGIKHDKSETLKDIGVSSPGPFTIVYDYKPISYPLLTTPLSYKTEHEIVTKDSKI